MLGSMYSAVSGLQAHQTKMNVIGNNIANVNTYGFKASRVTFSDVFYQTMTGASGPTNNNGGTNPTQLGYGSKVNSIDVLNTRAGSATTDRALDVYINGEGYLPVKDSDGVVKYTRVGVLNFDEAGNLVDRNGNMVLGFQLDGTTKNAQLGSDGTTTVQNLIPIKIAPAELEKYTGISIGQNGEITAVREGDPELSLGVNTGWLKSAHKIPSTTTYKGDIKVTGATSDTTTVGYIAPTKADGTAYTGTFTVPAGTDIMGPITLTWNNTTNTVTLKGTSKSGTAVSVDSPVTYDGTVPADLTFNVGGQPVSLRVDPTGASGPSLVAGAATTVGTTVPQSVTVNISVPTKAGTTENMSATWNYGNTTLDFGNGIAYDVNPSAFGTLDVAGLANSSLGSVGPGAGVPLKIAHLANVKFINQDGLEQDGDGYCVETTNSGEAVATMPGSGGTGNLRAGALEMSNVDLSREFTEMIITQRGFQANTRMITTSDEMLNELVNMKR